MEKFLLIGSTGMLGQSLYKKLKNEKYQVFAISRNNSDRNMDLSLINNELNEVIDEFNPDVIINCAAIVNLQFCEENPEKAYLINSKLPSLISLASQKKGCYFVQISTDHYYHNDNIKKHKETDNIVLLNEYARTKYAGEQFALTYENSLIVRTNIVGYRNKVNNPTFVEWLISALKNKEKLVGFSDYYTSSIDVETFNDLLLEVIKSRITGIVNIASKDVISKYEFMVLLSQQIGVEGVITKGKLNNQNGIIRANSLGLDITKLEHIIKNKEIPTAAEVVQNLVKKYKEGVFNGI
ncbi:dTDP-4-dehydrorhamnose reductase family protein [Brevibacillus migulae]|uniref:dTDP-4-dehydrorhamnose reductase family protein n=1 Tax=Brevibacillus migulae TaxID=1644114 RepID=UPI00106E5876|nr:SDR family oxidoreductase [Brevibacillus migulae]